MNYDHQFVMPCNYTTVGIFGDSIMVAQNITDSNKKTAQYFKYYDRHTLHEITDWLTQKAIHGQISRSCLQRRPRHHVRSIKNYHTRGRCVYRAGDLSEYEKDGITWATTGYQRFAEIYYSIRGIAPHDTEANYSAVIDTNGNYVIQPQKTKNTLRIINPADSLVVIETSNKDSFQCVTDYNLCPLLQFQKYEIATAFYYNHIFYAVSKHDRSYSVSYHNFERSGSSEAHDYTYYLVTADGQPAEALVGYKLHWNTDSKWSLRRRAQEMKKQGLDGFDLPFKGYFMAEDGAGESRCSEYLWAGAAACIKLQIPSFRTSRY